MAVIKPASWFRLVTSSERRLPDFVVIGVQKGGTRFLHHCLNQHPDIWLPDSKELHFFDVNFDKGLSWYKAFFPLKIFSKKKTVGEITPRYIVHKDTPDRFHSTLPSAKIIVLLRDPIERAHSHYQMTRRVFNLQIGFKEFILYAINNEATSTKSKEDDAEKLMELKLLERSVYSEQIKRWFKHYPREHFLFLESSPLFQTPEKALKKVYDFLNLPAILPNDLTPQHTGQYTKEIDDSIRGILRDYFKESNDWLRKEGFELEWLKDNDLSVD